MIRIPLRTVAVIAAVLASVTVTASPAFADGPDVADTKSGPSCWANADTGRVQCFDDDEELADAVLAQTGGPLVREAVATPRPAGALVTYVLSELYVNISYGGGVTAITSSSSTTCATGTVLGNLTGGANNSASSVKSYLGCSTTIYDLAGQGGTSYGPVVNAPSVGAMNDRATSYSVT